MNLPHLERIRIYELKYLLSVAKKLKLNKKEVRILEIGAGTGWQAKELTDMGFKVEALEVGSSNYSGNRVFPITNYDGHKIPFKNACFDIIFSSNVLEHIPHIEAFQSEMLRVLANDGIAVHILPSTTWRFWTNFNHYPALFKKILKVILKKASLSKFATDTESTKQSDTDRLTTLQLIRKAIFPYRHGEFGNAITELFYFSRKRWTTLFIKKGWKIKSVMPNRLLYTGHLLLGESLSIATRKKLSFFMGSSCHIYVLTKKQSLPEGGI